MYVPLDYTTDARVEALFRQAAGRLEQTQSELLMRYLDAARKSELARRHGLESVRTVREFQDAVPIAGYEAIADDIARMQAGAKRVRFDDPVQSFVRTGGTSGSAKVFAQRRLRNAELSARLIDVGVDRALIAHDHPDIAGGKELSIVGGTQPGQISFASALDYKRWYRKGGPAVIDPAWLAVLPHAPTRFYVIARLALAADVRQLTGLASALSVLARTISDSTESLLRDVRDGTITADLSAEARAVLPTLSPDPGLAEALSKRAAPSGVLTPRVVWPNLAVVRCMMSSSLGQNRDAIRAAYGAPLRESGYASTESALPLAFSVRDEDTNVVLGVQSAFCEFVDDAGKAHLAHEVSVGCMYRLVLTTAHGLYRYDTYDLFLVTGRELGGAPVLQFFGRARTSDLMGEKLSEAQVVEAVTQAASRALGGALAQFALVPRPSRDGVSPHYELRLEVRGEAVDVAALEDALEDALRAANVLYGAYRMEGGLGRVRVTPSTPAWFDALRAHLETLSNHAKVPIFLTEEKLPPGADT